MMRFDHSGCRLLVPDDLGDLFRHTWDELGSSGNGWTGAEKIALAQAARDVREGGSVEVSSITGAVSLQAVELIVRRPADADREWVRRMVDELSVVKYIELVGWVSILIAIDSFTRLMGLDLEPLPDPQPGVPEPVGEVPGLRIRKAWVPTVGLPLPRLALSAVPRTQKAANRLLNRLYKEPDQSREVASIRGLPPLQLELVASTVSHGNRCFYCTLSHLISLQAVAGNNGVVIDALGIADSSVDTRIEGAQELLALSRSAVSDNPDPGTVHAVAEVLGPEAAVTASEVAAGFMMINRLVEATGQPVLARQRELFMPVLEPLGAMAFPHSGMVVDREKPGIMTRIARKVRRSR
jgi:alkylhydroperoxidase family enzyme